jgi:hypothetical protein
MEELEGEFFTAYTRTVNLAQYWTTYIRQGASFVGHDQISYDDMKAKAALILDRLRKINLDLSVASARDALAEMEQAVWDPEGGAKGNWVFRGHNLNRACRHLEDLSVRFGQELESCFVLVIAPDKKQLYEQPEPLFGKEVDDAFGCAEDISEAGKCLALDRGTATVFHLMRAMEKTVFRLGEKLEVTIIDRNKDPLVWGKILANMKKPIEAMPAGANRDLWSEAFTHLYHVKQAWRNDVMHPKQTYTPEEAKVLFGAVRSFMQHLAKLVVTSSL